MKQLGKRWYHTICLDRAVLYFIHHFDFRLDQNLQIVEIKEKKP
jgi:hypothetical protein